MEDLFRSLVLAASRAPSVHNSQPWRFRVAGGMLLAGLDHDRLLPALDPTNRFAWMSLGAAVECARLAALRVGQDVEVRWFDSEVTADDGDDRWPVAVQPVAIRAIAHADLELAEWVERQVQVRGPMIVDQVPTTGEIETAAVAALPGARLKAPPAGRQTLIADLAERVTLAELTQRETRREHLSWTRLLPVGTQYDGVGAKELVRSRLARALAPIALSRPFMVPLGMPKHLARHARAIVATTPLFLAVVAAGSEPAAWFDAGRGWQRAALALTAQGFATGWLASLTALAEPEVRALFETSAAEPITLVARIGRPAGRPADQARRTPESVVR
jgi:hypothetical protein